MPDNAPKPQPELMKALGSLLKGTEYAPNAPSPSDVAPLADAEVPKWRREHHPGWKHVAKPGERGPRFDGGDKP